MERFQYHTPAPSSRRIKFSVGTTPRSLSSDHDPLFRFHRWRANLRVLEVDELKTVPGTPRSHAFVERLIGTIRREYLDRTWFWQQSDLERKLVRKSFLAAFPGQHDGHQMIGTAVRVRFLRLFLIRTASHPPTSSTEKSGSSSIRQASASVH
jgi:hypothetical protein